MYGRSRPHGYNVRDRTSATGVTRLCVALIRTGMSRSIGARVNDRVAGWVEEEAENRNTTIGRIVEEIVTEAYEEAQESQEGEGPLEAFEEEKDEYVYKAMTLETARGLRDEYERYLADTDDARLKEVRFAGDTSEGVLADIAEAGQRA